MTPTRWVTAAAVVLLLLFGTVATVAVQAFTGEDADSGVLLTAGTWATPTPPPPPPAQPPSGGGGEPPVSEPTATPTPAPTPAPESRPGAPLPGELDRPITDAGLTGVVWGGGTIDALVAQLPAGTTSVTVFADGRAVTFIPGAPEFVNAAFRALFADGVIPDRTILVVRWG